MKQKSIKDIIKGLNLNDDKMKSDPDWETLSEISNDHPQTNTINGTNIN
jgi:hypothetical protein